MKIILLILSAVSLLAQERATSMVITVSHQPLEVYKAAFGGSLKGVGLYQATVCNVTDGGLKVSEGILIQAIEKKVGVVNTLLALSTASRSKKHGKIYTISKFAEYGLLGASVFTAGGTIAASAGVRLALVAAQGVSSQIAEAAKGEAGLDLTVLNQFLDPAKTLVLDARGCGAKLALGSYKKSFDPFEVKQ